MRLREFWHDVEVQRGAVQDDDDKKCKSTRWTPPKGRDPWLDLYLEEVTASVIRETRLRGGGNLSGDEEEALLRLIKDDDKGSSITILNAEDHCCQIQRFP